ncbi:MAG: AAA family ATPase, partial [Candidatus Omnitrophota bacterium]
KIFIQLNKLLREDNVAYAIARQILSVLDSGQLIGRDTEDYIRDAFSEVYLSQPGNEEHKKKEIELLKFLLRIARKTGQWNKYKVLSCFRNSPVKYLATGISSFNLGEFREYLKYFEALMDGMRVQEEWGQYEGTFPAGEYNAWYINGWGGQKEGTQSDGSFVSCHGWNSLFQDRLFESFGYFAKAVIERERAQGTDPGKTRLSDNVMLLLDEIRKDGSLGAEALVDFFGVDVPDALELAATIDEISLCEGITREGMKNIAKYHILHGGKFLMEIFNNIRDKIWQGDYYCAVVLASFADKAPGLEKEIADAIKNISLAVEMKDISDETARNTREEIVTVSRILEGGYLVKALRDIALELEKPEADRLEKYSLKGIDGSISQGTEAKEEFRKLYIDSAGAGTSNNNKPVLVKKVKEFISGSEELKALYEGYDVFVVPGIVRGPDDFIMGHKDCGRKRVYLAEELVRTLPDALLEEYLWHEIKESPRKERHKLVILEQQKHERFSGHYRAAETDDTEIEIEGRKVPAVIDRATRKIYKGKLGMFIRKAIDDLYLIHCNDFGSAGDAAEVYRRLYKGDGIWDIITLYFGENKVFLKKKVLKALFEGLESKSAREMEMLMKCFAALEPLFEGDGPFGDTVRRAADSIISLKESFRKTLAELGEGDDPVEMCALFVPGIVGGGKSVDSLETLFRNVALASSKISVDMWGCLIKGVLPFRELFTEDPIFYMNSFLANQKRDGIDTKTDDMVYGIIRVFADNFRQKVWAYRGYILEAISRFIKTLRNGNEPLLENADAVEKFLEALRIMASCGTDGRAVFRILGGTSDAWEFTAECMKNSEARASTIAVILGACALAGSEHCQTLTFLWKKERDRCIYDLNMLAGKAAGYEGELVSAMAGVVKKISGTPVQYRDVFREELVSGARLYAGQELINYLNEIASEERGGEKAGLSGYDFSSAAGDKTLGRDKLTGRENIGRVPDGSDVEDGFIARGKEAIGLFKKNIADGVYRDLRDVSIEGKYAELLNGRKVFVVPAVVLGTESYVLGTRDKDVIYIAREVVAALGNEAPGLMEELIYHEINCNTEDAGSHAVTIVAQQKKYPGNYADQEFDYVTDKDGVLRDRKNGYKTAKGRLGRVLRKVIDDNYERFMKRPERGGFAEVMLNSPDMSGIDRVKLYELKKKYVFFSEPGYADAIRAEADFINSHGSMPEEKIRAFLAGVKLEMMWKMIDEHDSRPGELPCLRKAGGKLFFFIFSALLENNQLYMNLFYLYRMMPENIPGLGSGDEQLLEYFKCVASDDVGKIGRSIKNGHLLDIFINFVLTGGNRDLIERMERVYPDFYTTVAEWEQNVRIKGVREGLDASRVRILREMGEMVPQDLMKRLFRTFFVDILGDNFHLTEGDMEVMKNIFRIFAAPAGVKETRALLGRLGEIKAYFEYDESGRKVQDVTNAQLIDALADIAMGAKKQINEQVSLMTGKCSYLVNRDINRFKLIGVIISNTGIDGFNDIKFDDIRMKYNIREHSMEEIELLKLVARLSAVAKDGTGALIDEIVKRFYGETGKDMSRLNSLVSVLKTFICIVNFHYDYERYVNKGTIGKVNNETCYISLRDLNRALAIISAEYAAGNSLHTAARRAVERRYYNRLTDRDREEVKNLMRLHGLLRRNEDLDHNYIFEGAEKGSKLVRILEQPAPKVSIDGGIIESDRKELAAEIVPGEEFTGLDSSEVLNSSTKRNLGRLMRALVMNTKEKLLNPVMLFGVTSGGKSTIARLAAKIFGAGYTRIQITERTDEFELFGSYQPYEVDMSLSRALERLEEAVKNGEYSKLADALSRMRHNDGGRYFRDLMDAKDDRKKELGIKDDMEKYLALSGKEKADKKQEITGKALTWEITALIREARMSLGMEEELESTARETKTLTPDEDRALSRIRLAKSLAALMDHEIGLRFVEGRFLKAYRKSHLILLDEVNLANEEMIGVIYQMLTMGYLEYNGKEIKPENGGRPRIVATANPSSYAGRNRMSEAFMNRFEIINVDDMTPEELVEIVEQQLSEKGLDLEKDLGISRRAFKSLAVLGSNLNNLIEAGRFSRMNNDRNYVFTIRNLFRIVDDIAERKKQGLEVSENTWLEEAFLEYSGVLLRYDVFDRDKFTSHPDYALIRDAVRNVWDISDRDFDALITKRFLDVDYHYDRHSRDLRIDGITTKGRTPVEDVPCDELVEVNSSRYAQIAVMKNLRASEKKNGRWMTQPLLFVGQSGGGKSGLIADAVKRVGGKYTSVSLGDATLESLVGTMEYDKKEKRFKYRPGILIKAMTEGSVLVLEELNMAKSGILEILNEYFDEGTFINPFTLKEVRVHEDFRLFATMNPIEGTMGTNEGRKALSPALRNRFREVWVPHEKTEAEIKAIITDRLKAPGVKMPVEKITEKIWKLYSGYKKEITPGIDRAYYTSLRDLGRITGITGIYVRDMGLAAEEALSLAARRVYGRRIDRENFLRKFEKILKEAGIKEYREKPAMRARLIEILKKAGITTSFEARVREDLASSGRPGVSNDDVREAVEEKLAKSAMVEDKRTEGNLLDILHALNRGENSSGEWKFSPVMLMGETGTGKSKICRYIAENLLGQSYSRIQFTERTDEYDLFGSYEPREVKMGFDDAYMMLTETMKRGEWVKITKALKYLKKGTLTRADELAMDLPKKRVTFSGEIRTAMAEMNRCIRSAFRDAETEDDARDKEEAVKRVVNMGYLLQNGIMNVELEFKEGRLLKAMKRGDLVVLDEINLADEEVLGILYQLLTMGYVEYYDREKGEIARIFPAKGFRLIATANPAGYSGRNVLSEAFLNRFEILHVKAMSPQDMAAVAVDKYSIGEKAIKDLVTKLCLMQEELNGMLKDNKFKGINSSPQGGYMFTLRDVERVIKDMRELVSMGDPSPPGEILIREAFITYSGILGRDKGNIEVLHSLFKDKKYFNKDMAVPDFCHVKTATGLRIGSIELKTPENPSKEKPVIEPLVKSPSTNLVQYQIAKGFHDRTRPVLLVGQSGAGKSEMIGDLARDLNYRYISVSLGNITLESLVGSYCIDPDTKKFVYKEGILIDAMANGGVLVLEEINMADPGLIEILNEFFDEDSFTNPMTGERVNIHPDFRLFATMNPVAGVTGSNSGRNLLSPAFRSRFNEVWVDHKKTDEEIKEIIEHKMRLRGIASAADSNITGEVLRCYKEYTAAVETRRIGKEVNEGYFASLRDITKICDLMAVDIIERGFSAEQAVKSALYRVFYLRLNSKEDRSVVLDEILKIEEQDMYSWERREDGYSIKKNGYEMAKAEAGLFDRFVLTGQSKTAVARLIDAMSFIKSGVRSFNPIMLLGETAGGKSTIAELAAAIKGKRFTRIQVNQRTDEYDLFGTYHPVEVEMDDEKAYEVIKEALISGKEKFYRLKRAMEKMDVSLRDMAKYAGMDAATSKEEDILRQYVEKYYMKAYEAGDKDKMEDLRRLAILMMNGAQGIDLEFKRGLFFEAMIRGDVVLLDEVNLAGEETMALIYQLITLGYIEFQGKKVYPGKGFQLIVSLNPSRYSGRNRLSEAFMDRFEIQYVRDMEPAEMAEIVYKKYRLGDYGIELKDVEKLATAQKKIDEYSINGMFDYFNTERSYKFALRNLERIAEDYIRRVEDTKARPSLDMLLEEAYAEYSGLLDETDKNIDKVKALFRDSFAWEPEDPGKLQYELEHMKEEPSIIIRGVKVRKKPAETETMASRIKKLTELVSMGSVRTQILKGFRDGEVRKEVTTDRRTVSKHRTRPVLLVGQSGGGKTEMVGDIARELNWKYISVSLGAATVESLIGSYVLDEKNGGFVFKEGILVKAMKYGYAIVLEEINMAEASVIEVLNEYFDRGTFTVQEKRVELDIHPDFRLFATMNPVQGKTGRNAGRIGLSPALRSRFREVWVRSERTRGEEYRIMLGGITDMIGPLMEHGTRDHEEITLGISEYIWNKQDGKKGEDSPASVMRPDPGAPVTEGPSPLSGPGSPGIRMAKPDDGEGKAEKKPITEKERDIKKKKYIDTFIQVSKGQVRVAESPPDEEGQYHWAYNPDTNTLYFPPDAIDAADEEELVAVGVHESMHRWLTRYMSRFREFIARGKLEGMIFNVIDDGRIENCARLRFPDGRVAACLRHMNDRSIFGDIKDKKKLLDTIFGPRFSYSALIQNFFLYLAKRGSDPDSEERVKEIIEKLKLRSKEFGEDMEKLAGSGVFGGSRKGDRPHSYGGARDEDMLDESLRGVFSMVPLRVDENGRIAFEENPSEEYIQQLAQKQGELIRELILPYAYKWAVKDVKEKKGGKGKPEEGKPEEGKPGDKVNKNAGGGDPGDMKEWKELWDQLTPEEKQELEGELQKNLGDKARDRTKEQSKDFQSAKQNSSIGGDMSERGRLLEEVGKYITELTGHLREIIHNVTRPKEIRRQKKGIIEMRDLMNALGGGLTNLRFYKQRLTPAKKKLKFTIVIDESGSMSGMDHTEAAKGYNTLKGAFVLMETLANLEDCGIDFCVSWFGSNTGLHRRFKNQPNREGADVPNNYSGENREKIVDDIYRSIGRKGDNNEQKSLTETIEDIKAYGEEQHFVIVFTDGQTSKEAVQAIIDPVRKNNGYPEGCGVRTEFIGVGIGDDTADVPETYGTKYSIHLKNGELHMLPVRMRHLLEKIMHGVYLDDTGEGASSILSGTAKWFDAALKIPGRALRKVMLSVKTHHIEEKDTRDPASPFSLAALQDLYSSHASASEFSGLKEFMKRENSLKIYTFREKRGFLSSIVKRARIFFGYAGDDLPGDAGAFSNYDENAGVLEIYISESIFAGLSEDEKLWMAANVVDHEYTESVTAPGKGIPREKRHAYASLRSSLFVQKRNDITYFHGYAIRNMPTVELLNFRLSGFTPNREGIDLPLSAARYDRKFFNAVMAELSRRKTWGIMPRDMYREFSQDEISAIAQSMGAAENDWRESIINSFMTIAPPSQRYALLSELLSMATASVPGREHLVRRLSSFFFHTQNLTPLVESSGDKIRPYPGYEKDFNRLILGMAGFLGLGVTKFFSVLGIVEHKDGNTAIKDKYKGLLKEIAKCPAGFDVPGMTDAELWNDIFRVLAECRCETAMQFSNAIEKYLDKISSGISHGAVSPDNFQFFKWNIARDLALTGGLDYAMRFINNQDEDLLKGFVYYDPEEKKEKFYYPETPEEKAVMDELLRNLALSEKLRLLGGDSIELLTGFMKRMLSNLRGPDGQRSREDIKRVISLLNVLTRDYKEDDDPGWRYHTVRALIDAAFSDRPGQGGNYRLMKALIRFDTYGNNTIFPLFLKFGLVRSLDRKLAPYSGFEEEFQDIMLDLARLYGCGVLPLFEGMGITGGDFRIKQEYLGLVEKMKECPPGISAGSIPGNEAWDSALTILQSGARESRAFIIQHLIDDEYAGSPVFWYLLEKFASNGYLEAVVAAIGGIRDFCKNFTYYEEEQKSSIFYCPRPGEEKAIMDNLLGKVAGMCGCVGRSVEESLGHINSFIFFMSVKKDKTSPVARKDVNNILQYMAEVLRAMKDENAYSAFFNILPVFMFGALTRGWEEQVLYREAVLMNLRLYGGSNFLEDIIALTAEMKKERNDADMEPYKLSGNAFLKVPGEEAPAALLTSFLYNIKPYNHDEIVDSRIIESIKGRPDADMNFSGLLGFLEGRGTVRWHKYSPKHTPLALIMRLFIKFRGLFQRGLGKGAGRAKNDMRQFMDLLLEKGVLSLRSYDDTENTAIKRLAKMIKEFFSIPGDNVPVYSDYDKGNKCLNIYISEDLIREFERLGAELHGYIINLSPRRKPFYLYILDHEYTEHVKALEQGIPETKRHAFASLRSHLFSNDTSEGLCVYHFLMLGRMAERNKYPDFIYEGFTGGREGLEIPAEAERYDKNFFEYFISRKYAPAVPVQAAMGKLLGRADYRETWKIIQAQKKLYDKCPWVFKTDIPGVTDVLKSINYFLEDTIMTFVNMNREKGIEGITPGQSMMIENYLFALFDGGRVPDEAYGNAVMNFSTFASILSHFINRPEKFINRPEKDWQNIFMIMTDMLKKSGEKKDDFVRAFNALMELYKDGHFVLEFSVLMELYKDGPSISESMELKESLITISRLLSGEALVNAVSDLAGEITKTRSTSSTEYDLASFETGRPYGEIGTFEEASADGKRKPFNEAGNTCESLKVPGGEAYTDMMTNKEYRPEPDMDMDTDKRIPRGYDGVPNEMYSPYIRTMLARNLFSAVRFGKRGAEVTSLDRETGEGKDEWYGQADISGRIGLLDRLYTGLDEDTRKALEGLKLIFIPGQRPHYGVSRPHIYLDIKMLTEKKMFMLKEYLIHELTERQVSVATNRDEKAVKAVHESLKEKELVSAQSEILKAARDKDKRIIFIPWTGRIEDRNAYEELRTKVKKQFEDKYGMAGIIVRLYDGTAPDLEKEAEKMKKKELLEQGSMGLVYVPAGLSGRAEEFFTG